MKENETAQVKFWQSADFDNLELLRADSFKHWFPKHAHDEFTIGVMLEGELSIDYGSEVRVMPPNNIFVINPGEIHSGAPATENGWTYRVFYPKASLLQRINSNLADKPRDVPFFTNNEIYDPKIARSLLNLHAVLEDETSTSLEREVLFETAFGDLIEHHSDDPPPIQPTWKEVEYIAKVRDYIEANYSQPITLNQLASLVSLNPSYFLRIFKTCTGITPLAFINQTRIARAKEFLAQGMSITDVAHRTGFVDQSHFSKRFKPIMGLTPGQYAAAFKK